MRAKCFLWIGLTVGIVPAVVTAADFTGWGKRMEIAFSGYSGSREARNRSRGCAAA